MIKESFSKNPVLKLSFDFSLSVISFCEGLEQERKFLLARQLLRSGTSIGAHVVEAQNVESRAGFIHKFKIAAKEAEETAYWLLLSEYANHNPGCTELLARVDVLNKVIGKIISTTRKRNPVSYLLSFLLV